MLQRLWFLIGNDGEGTMMSLIGTGNAELDNILGGGLPVNRVYLLQGSPGAGKTTLAMQFLLEGVSPR